MFWVWFGFGNYILGELSSGYDVSRLDWFISSMMLGSLVWVRVVIFLGCISSKHVLVWVWASYFGSAQGMIFHVCFRFGFDILGQVKLGV